MDGVKEKYEDIRQRDIEDIRGMYMGAFGVEADKEESKGVLAYDVAKFLVAGECPDGINSPKQDECGTEATNSSPGKAIIVDVVEKDVAVAALSRARGAWDCIEKIKADKKAVMDGYKDAISKANEDIECLFIDKGMSSEDKIDKLDSKWEELKMLKADRATKIKEFNAILIDANKDIVDAFENIKQIQLPFGR